MNLLNKIRRAKSDNMEYKKVVCIACGNRFQIATHIRNYGCNECGHIHIFDASPEPSKAPVNAVLADVENSPTILSGKLDEERLGEAEDYWLKAEFILHGLQANIQVYGNNSAWSGAQPADVELALKYINRSLEIWPDNPKYLNLKALFLMEGLGDREGGLELMERAAALSPNDITIQDNLEKLKSNANQCFVATAAYGSSHEWQVVQFREWRDEVLMSSRTGRMAVSLYYRFSPKLASQIRHRPWARRVVRRALNPLATLLRRTDR